MAYSGIDVIPQALLSGECHSLTLTTAKCQRLQLTLSRSQPPHMTVI